MNQVINFFWTILSFAPVVAFWLGTGLTVWFYLFAGVCAISLFVPANALQLSGDPRFYERLGVKFIRQFVQNGDLAKRFQRKGKPDYKAVKNKTDAVKYMSTVSMYQRFHLLCLLFFLMTAIYAVLLTQFKTAAIILLANMIYNICPILLQQYNLARISRVTSRR